MKKVCKAVVFLMAISLFQSTECYADNPMVQTNYTADLLRRSITGLAICIPLMTRTPSSIIFIP